MQLEAIFAKVFSEPVTSITPDISTRNFKKWDSLSHVELITTIEMTYRIRFANAEIPALTSFKAIVEKLQQKGITPTGNQG